MKEVLIMERENKEKLNLSVTPEIKEYLDKQSIAFGMSISAYVTMLVSNYRQQVNSMAQLSEITETVKKLEKLAEQNIKIPSEIEKPSQN